MNLVDPCKSLALHDVHCATEMGADSPLLADFEPEVDRTPSAKPAIRRAATVSSRRIAVAFAGLGFAIVEDQAHYQMPLDAETDRLLLRLYDLIAGLRWRHPHRQLALFGNYEVADD
jgi:hypothetical protein